MSVFARVLCFLPMLSGVFGHVDMHIIYVCLSVYLLRLHAQSHCWLE